MADSRTPVIELDEEIEGEEVGTKNFRFVKIGKPVPINSGAPSGFDPNCLPSRPLVVSERFGLLFVAHPEGFSVSRTKDIMASAEAIQENKVLKSVQESSLAYISIGKISLLALSADDSVLAACTAASVHFFAVSALHHKEKRPALVRRKKRQKKKLSYTVSLDEPTHIKDFLWARKDAKVYIILAANGKLYSGSGQGPLSYVMKDVDAVDWSVEGNFIAVAKENRVSILSYQFKEKLCFLLQFRSATEEFDVDQVMKVDSIKWVRSDCIAVGCFQINEDEEEENYVVQVITSNGRRIIDVTESSKPTVLSFNNIFMEFSPDAVPAKYGPHLFLSYLSPCGLAFVANRSLSCSVRLFCWSLDNEKNDITVAEILEDAWNLHIHYQDGDKENVIVGLSVDKVSQNENVATLVGNIETEVSPCCIIICLTIDGKISFFHFASAAGALVSPEGCIAGDEDDDSKTSTKHEELGGTEAVNTGAEHVQSVEEEPPIPQSQSATQVGSDPIHFENAPFISAPDRALGKNQEGEQIKQVTEDGREDMGGDKGKDVDMEDLSNSEDEHDVDGLDPVERVKKYLADQEEKLQQQREQIFKEAQQELDAIAKLQEEKKLAKLRKKEARKREELKRIQEAIEKQKQDNLLAHSRQREYDEQKKKEDEDKAVMARANIPIAITMQLDELIGKANTQTATLNDVQAQLEQLKIDQGKHFGKLIKDVAAIRVQEPFRLKDVETWQEKQEAHLKQQDEKFEALQNEVAAVKADVAQFRAETKEELQHIRVTVDTTMRYIFT